MTKRRRFIQQVSNGAAGLAMIPIISSCGSNTQKKESAPEAEASPTPLFFQISLAQWSLNRKLFGGELDNLDFPGFTKSQFDITAVEYVNQFFADKAEDQAYLGELKKRTDDQGITNVLIMIDREGYLGDLDESKRIQAVENHYKWVDAAKFLGCHSIRVNAHGEGSAEDVKSAAIDGLGRLSEYGTQNGIGVIVENHGGYSSDGKWLSDVMSQVNNPNCGTLPDFGNFCLKRGEPTEEFKYGQCLEEYDRYAGVEELMPFAKGVSAKSHEFDDQGMETGTDFRRMLKIVKEAGYKGHIGIEYEGPGDDVAGIKATKALLEMVGGEIS